MDARENFITLTSDLWWFERLPHRGKLRTSDKMGRTRHFLFEDK